MRRKTIALTDQIKDILPNVDAQSVGNIAFWGIIAIVAVLVIIGLFGLWAWWYITKRKFNKKIIIWARVDNRDKIVFRDKAMERKIGTGGDTIFYFQKKKKIVPRGEIQTGDNTYWYYERPDGELINIGMTNIDLSMREAGVRYLDKETRYGRASLQKLNKDRFNKETWWQKYGKDVMTVVFIVVVSVMLLLILMKMVELMGSITNAMENFEEITKEIARLMGAVDNLNGGSGVVPA